MIKTFEQHHTTRPVPGVGSEPSKNVSQRSIFLVAALNMSWQLAIVVLVPIIGGVQLDKKLGTSSVFTFIGLGVAALGAGVVMWRTVQLANKLPVPKLTEAQKRAIKKQYEEEDNE